jgi:hypothetical protein
MESRKTSKNTAAVSPSALWTKPMDVTISLPKPHSGQRSILREAKRFNVVCCGRRFGKTSLGVRLDIKAALVGQPVAWFSPTYRMLMEVWRELTDRLATVARRVSTQEHRIELLTGGLIDLWSLTEPNVARGRKYGRVIIDEAAMVADLEQAWQAVIRPTLADYQGDAWLLSTPRGQNYFATLFDLGQHDPEWASWQRTTHDNPYIPPEEIDAMRRELPALVYDQEVLAQIVTSDLHLFKASDLDAATEGAIGEQPAQPHHSYVTSVDVGRRQDATVINTFDTTNRPYQRVAHERIERAPYPAIQQRIEARVRAYPGICYVESNGVGDPVIENLNVQVQPFITTAKSKTQALQSLQLLLEKGRLKAQWTAQERRELMQYQWADTNLVQDCVMSLAIGAANLEKVLQVFL